MSFIKNLQNKPQAEKMRIIWMTTAAVVVVLISIWIISARYYKNVPEDTTLFQSIGKGVKDVKDNYGK